MFPQLSFYSSASLVGKCCVTKIKISALEPSVGLHTFNMAFRKPRQENCESEVNLGYTARPCLTTKTNKLKVKA